MKIRFVIGLCGALGFAAPLAAYGHGDKAGGEDAMFTKMDANSDGKISADEHAAAAKTMFDQMDANHDGKVTADEMTAAHDKIAGKKGHNEMSAADKIKTCDKDGDGALSADEHTACAKTMFDKMDTDHDGYLTKAELQAGHDEMKKASSTSKSTAK